MENTLEAIDASSWHPQDLLIICQAIHEFAENGSLSDARATRAYAILFGLIDTSEIPLNHTEFTDYDHLSDMNPTALAEWMGNQVDETWGEDLVIE